ncbi:hypothetical protein SAMN06297280_2647 [Arsukibacterium tuosuense]|uniref:Uncharacterized protein n=1 Tax=Arsukibacterium tuosuense TaxID=1323745 RepID=A0A285J2H4_9GAMM|nr:hypothetical protein [Arsukibacterium tuosuense]SNY54418.1 hypothetical protein SAMN06297280_2647 [Arsukibacterium tuosuense]
MNDLLNSIKLFFYERVSNPLVTAFCFSWLVFNYQFILVFFSGEDIIGKFHFLSEIYDSPSHLAIPKKWTIGLIYPLTTALTYIFFFPFLAKYVIKFHYQRSTELKNIKNIAEGEVLVSNKKAREIQRKINTLETEKEELETRHKSEIKAFQEQIETLTTETNGRLEVMQKNLSDVNQENTELKAALKVLKDTAEGSEATKINAEKNLAMLREQLSNVSDDRNSERARQAIKSAITHASNSLNVNSLYELIGTPRSNTERDLAFLIISNLLNGETMSKEEVYSISKAGKSETGSMLNRLASKNILKHEKDADGRYRYSLTKLGIEKVKTLLANAS